MIAKSQSQITSHQLRTPLNAIIGFTGTLLMKLPGPLTADQEKQLRIIQESARTLLSLVDKLTDRGLAMAEAANSKSVPTGEIQADFTPRQTSRKARILLIEDDSFSQKLMVYLLQAMGHEALVAGDGKLGLAMARHELPDLILCDLQLPILNGYEVARELKQDPVLREIPLVAVTAFTSIQLPDEIADGDFDYHLSKPIRSETLAAQLQAFILGGAVAQLRSPAA